MSGSPRLFIAAVVFWFCATATLADLDGSTRQFPRVFVVAEDLARIRAQRDQPPWSMELSYLHSIVLANRKETPSQLPPVKADARKFARAAVTAGGESSPIRLVRHLALYYAIDPDEKNRWAAERAIAILLRWADSTVLGSEHYTSEMPLPPRIGPNYSGRGLHMAIVAVNAVFATDLLYGTFSVPAEQRARIDAWLTRIGEEIVRGNRYWREARYFGQDFNNHLSHHNLGLLAIGTLLGRDDWVSYSFRSDDNDRDFHEMVAGAIFDGVEPSKILKLDAPPNAGELFDIYRKEKNFDYAFFHMIALGLFASIAENRGLNAWRHTAPGGESIKQAVIFHARFLSAYACATKISGVAGLPGSTHYKGRRLARHHWQFAEFLLSPFLDDPDVRELLEHARVNRCPGRGWTAMPVYQLPFRFARD
jgi:hypothetical protein